MSLDWYSLSTVCIDRVLAALSQEVEAACLQIFHQLSTLDRQAMPLQVPAPGNLPREAFLYPAPCMLPPFPAEHP